MDIDNVGCEGVGVDCVDGGVACAVVDRVVGVVDTGGDVGRSVGIDGGIILLDGSQSMLKLPTVARPNIVKHHSSF